MSEGEAVRSELDGSFPRATADDVAKKPLDIKQIFRYLFSGGSSFLLDFALLYVFKAWVGMPAWLAAAAAFVIATVFSYYMQKLFTFSSDIQNRKAMWRFLALVAFNTAMAAVIVQAFDSFFGLYLVGKIVASTLTTIWNYPLMRRWVFPSNSLR
ncbi:GtrA family protein [uncultured Mobiluncus sp.]|uniref:GtrA family protein n=1 Tax=uncultured Mobiluncus sp. TaxID=293425 RepID=UPI00261853AE|nr:GtrA family protein [uncultured Mobiluncus sp.]